MNEIAKMEKIDAAEALQSEYGVVIGFFDYQSSSGIQAHAIDGKTGEPIARHFCSGEGFAQSDLGFGMNGIPMGGSDLNNERRNKVYSHKFPDGYITYWIGDAHATDFGKQMLDKRADWLIKSHIGEMIELSAAGKTIDDLAELFLVRRIEYNGERDLYEDRVKNEI